MSADSPLSQGEEIIGEAVASAHPSLALIKYWGKQDVAENIPATPSLAITLDSLTTETAVLLTSTHEVPEDRVFIGGQLQPSDRFAPFFSAFRRFFPNHESPSFSVTARSMSNYPSAAGLASSAAGFAALAKACTAAADLKTGDGELSALARIGSASAARSLFGGFVRLDAGAKKAVPVKDADWWPGLRIIVVEVAQVPKSISTREAMESVRTTSPFYSAWIEDSPNLMDGALAALEERNLDELGPLMRMSYLRMFGTMFSANPPIVYWKPNSLGLIAACNEMRRKGLSVWETMDAGPQVKILCSEEHLEAVEHYLADAFASLPRRVCRIGEGAAVIKR